MSSDIYFIIGYISVNIKPKNTDKKKKDILANKSTKSTRCIRFLKWANSSEVNNERKCSVCLKITCWLNYKRRWTFPGDPILGFVYKHGKMAIKNTSILSLYLVEFLQSTSKTQTNNFETIWRINWRLWHTFLVTSPTSHRCRLSNKCMFLTSGA